MKLNVLLIRLCFINSYTYLNPKSTPYNYVKIFVVQRDKKYAILMPSSHSCLPSSLNPELHSME